MRGQTINRIISILYRYGQRYFTQKIKECQLPLEVGHIPFMMQVYRNPGITQEGISANAVMDKGTTARCIKQMESLDLVTRKVDEEDRRVNHIYPTQRAMENRPKLLRTIEELHDILYEGFSEEEIDTANSLMNRMKENIAAWMDKRSD